MDDQPLYLWLWKPFQRCYTRCCSPSLGVGHRVWQTGGAVLPSQLPGPSVPLWVTRVAGDHSRPISPPQEAWPEVLSFGKSLCPSWLCCEQDGPGLCVLRSHPRAVRVKHGAGMGSGQGHSRSLLHFQWKTGNLQGGASCPCQT